MDSRMDSRIQDALNDILLKRDHDSVDDFEHLGHDGSPDDRPEQQSSPRPINAPHVEDLLHIGDSFQDSVLPSALLDTETKPVPATPPPSADFDKCAAMAQSSDPFQQPLNPVDPKLASMAFVKTEQAYRHQFHDNDDDDDDDDDDNEEEEINLQPPLLPASTATTIHVDSDLLPLSAKAAIDSENPATLLTDYGKRDERDVTQLGSTNVDENFMQNIRSSMLPTPEKSPLIDFLGDDGESSRQGKVKNITDDDSWNVVERTDLKREQARLFEPPTKPLPPLPREEQLLEKARQDVYETSSDFLAAETVKPSPLPQQTAAGSKHEIINKRRETSKSKEADHISSRPIDKEKQEIEIAPKEIFRDMGLGNTDLEKWSANSIRRAGLCADHFNENSFRGEGKKKLKRGAIPLPFRNIASSESKKPTNVHSMPIAVEVTDIENVINVMETKGTNENATRPTTLAHVQKDKITRQSFQWPPLRTYRSPKLYFNAEDDNMEWTHVEPPICKKVSTETKTIKKKEQIKNEDSKPKIIINSLRRENVRLRQTIKTLKLRLQRYIRRTPVKRTSEKNKKKIIQELMDENKLHPVAKTMINLQLHTPNAPYTEEEKNISKQLYYYSASALRGLRKAGCNFPTERTIQRWNEEYNMMPGFCDFIFQKLEEKIAKIPVEERVCALK